jgi:hypothetical protein
MPTNKHTPANTQASTHAHKRIHNTNEQPNTQAGKQKHRQADKQRKRANQLNEHKDKQTNGQTNKYKANKQRVSGIHILNRRTTGQLATGTKKRASRQTTKQASSEWANEQTVTNKQTDN